MEARLTSNLPEVSRWLRGVPERIERAQAQGAHAIAAHLLRAVQAETPVVTGQMRGAAEAEVQVSRQGVRIQVGYDLRRAPHAIHVLRGRRARVIVPRQAQALRFLIRGRVVFSARARQKAVPPNDILGRVLERERQVVVRLMFEAVKRGVRG